MSRALAFGVVAIGCSSLATSFAFQSTSRLSVSSTGVQGNSASSGPVVSDSGRFVAFSSTANNLVPGDTNVSSDAFVRDLILGTIERVSVDSAGAQGNGYSYSTAISRDGRYVAYGSSAADLVAGDTNGENDAFARDRELGVTVRVNVSSSGAQALGFSGECILSGDGRVAAFLSFASNLVPNDTNGTGDVFVRDFASGTTTRVNLAANGAEADGGTGDLAISGDGRFIAFASNCANQE